MSDAIVQQITHLMEEQVIAYGRLNGTCEHLVIALVRGEPLPIESLTRTGERELLGMRARLAQITGMLNSFAQYRQRNQTSPLSLSVKSEFERVSQELMAAAQNFQRICHRASSLTANGTVFAWFHIEKCGVQAMTYNPPHGRRKGW